MKYIPNILEKNERSEHMFDLLSKLLKERIILLSGDIDDQSACLTIAQLLYLSALSKDPIKMYINSPGGSVYAGLAIYDTMQTIDCEVHTLCMGMAASMAAVLLAGGTTGKRSALVHSEVMIHQPLGGINGQASDMEIAANHIIKMRKKLNQILSKHTGVEFDKIVLDCDRDFFMDASEALEYGIIDKVI